ncbi:restriction endonuclease subunit S [Flavobacterium muglaense]|uniref:Restriction endonuclease subunit S n=1 Tax=Flavobacterium muglaense TaxID=2764716 RepID=A0A923MYV8_9FLAO|nr:restriction endonuclease subunit S [Flavobacterium muglaense]MBC5837755.1 restriction endonuclease subunit S [Flavobacterium muglaense]MBC5844281.1 restriction endonuclease subunit S [Flavobacterium muglaense]
MNKVCIPKLRFCGFEGENNTYEKYSFKDMFLFSTGKNIKQNEASPDFETPCVRYGELYHMYNEVIHKVINKTNLDKSELVFSKGNEILLPSAGEDPLDIGSASALTIENIAIGRTINILSPIKENVYSQIYVSYYINEKLRKKISKLAKGSSISNVYNSDLKTLAITLPSLPEQQKIASFLSSVDDKIQQLSRKKELLEQYKKGVMQQLFSGKLRFKPAQSEVEGMNGEDYADWEEKNLGEVATKKSSNISANKIEDNFGDFIIYGASGILKKVDFYKEENDYISIVKDGAGVGRLFFCKGKSSVLGTMELISPKQNIDTYFLYCLLSNIDFVKYVTGSTIPHIYFKDYSNEICGIPSLPEQQKIANFLSGIDDKIENTHQEINNMQGFKKGLLQQMFV